MDIFTGKIGMSVLIYMKGQYEDEFSGIWHQ